MYHSEWKLIHKRQKTDKKCHDQQLNFSTSEVLCRSDTFFFYQQSRKENKDSCYFLANFQWKTCGVVFLFEDHHWTRVQAAGNWDTFAKGVLAGKWQVVFFWRGKMYEHFSRFLREFAILLPETKVWRFIHVERLLFAGRCWGEWAAKFFLHEWRCHDQPRQTDDSYPRQWRCPRGAVGEKVSFKQLLADSGFSMQCGAACTSFQEGVCLQNLVWRERGIPGHLAPRAPAPRVNSLDFGESSSSKVPVLWDFGFKFKIFACWNEKCGHRKSSCCANSCAGTPLFLLYSSLTKIVPRNADVTGQLVFVFAGSSSTTVWTAARRFHSSRSLWRKGTEWWFSTRISTESRRTARSGG